MGKKKHQIYDVAVVGAGPVGITLALLLGNLSLKVCLVSPQKFDAPPQKDGRNFALMQRSWQTLEKIGLTNSLYAKAQPIQALKAINSIDTPMLPFWDRDIIIGQDDVSAESNPTTDFGYMVPAEALNAALFKAIKRHKNVSKHYGKVISQATEDTHQTLILDNHQTQETVSARLVCACDGLNSIIRRLAGIEVESRNYKTIVFNFDAKLDTEHDGIAKQVYTPKGPCALLPLQGERANFAWYVRAKEAGFLKTLDLSAFQNEFNALHGTHFGTVTIESAAPITYPLKMQIAQDIIAKRTALLGTAARHVNPMVGQGLNIGLKDVAALAHTIENALAIGSDLGANATLEAYKRLRWGDGTAWALGIDGLERLFSSQLPLSGLARNLAMSGANRLSPFRRFLAGELKGAVH